MPNDKGIAAELRRAIRNAERRGTTRYQIAKAARMPQSQVGRVASGESDPTLGTAERIARAIGYKIAIVPVVANSVAPRVT
jgi:transcriptional regulator with XRE-family HTH domain